MVTSVKEISCATVKTWPDCCEWLLFCQDKFQSEAVLHRCHLEILKRSLVLQKNTFTTMWIKLLVESKSFQSSSNARNVPPLI